MSDETKSQEAEDLVPMTNGELALAMPEMEAIALQSLLAANGIEAILNGTATLPNLPFEIYVPSASLEQATRIFLEARKAGAAAAEEAEAAGEAAGDIAPAG